LESSLSNCSNLKDFPASTYGAISGLDFNDNPVICGGAYTQECLSWQDSIWQNYEPKWYLYCFGKIVLENYCS